MANRCNQMDPDDVFEQTASVGAANTPRTGAELDMPFESASRDGQIPDSQDDELYNEGEPGVSTPRATTEAQNGVPKPGHVALAVADDKEDDEVISKDFEREGHVEKHLAPSPRLPRGRFEVRIPGLSHNQRGQYREVRSNTIETVNREDPTEAGQTYYHVDFTDGREESITHSELVSYQNGQAAFFRFRNPQMEVLGKRMREDADTDEWKSTGADPASDGMDLDGENEPVVKQSRRTRSRSVRSLPSRAAATRQSSTHHSLLSDEGEGDATSKDSPQPRRSLRARRRPQNIARDRDEPQEGPRSLQDDDEDLDFVNFVQSDVIAPKNVRSKSRRLQTRRSGRNLARKRPPDSDIEFEAPRRSARSTRNKLDMRDDALMDEDSFYVVEEKDSSVPKVISIREVFKPISPESAFASAHIDSCHTCGGSKQRGQLVHCQGCSLTFHKTCLGYRSGREHMVTKIGDDDFVMQCKYCIGFYRKKDVNAPRYDMCQVCKGAGKACAAFSAKKTSRQEEKLREQNGGVDPITPVSLDLVNNPELVLFRCVQCHRGWHIDHLPPIGKESCATDVQLERLKDYSIDWKCNECSSARHKIQRLVAWRPATDDRPPPSRQTDNPSTLDFDEDSKEYLVKWESTSYFHCSWKPSAWVFGVVASAMRNAFAKRDVERSLLHYSKDDAIPEEYLMPDIILNLKTDGSTFVSSKRKKDELSQASRIRKIFVKFRGLGYDDAVWDTPPKQSGDKAIYNAFFEAYHDYLDGKFFEYEPYNEIRDRVRAYKTSEFGEVGTQPNGLQRGKLMSYQIEGLNWLMENYHGGKSVVLADEMGLGKTVQVISLVASLVQDTPRCWPFLIVVPNATCPNWRREFKQWTPDLRVVGYHGGKASQELAYKYELFPQGSKDMRAHVVIMSYDSAADPQTKTLFKNIHWQGLVVDEGQRLKNDQNLLYTALKSLRIPFRLLLTGTPLQNNKRELFNLLQFIDDTQDASKLDLEYEVLDKETLPKLHEKIRPYFLRRTKAGVLKFLPAMAQIILPVTMTVIQEKLSKSIMAKNPQLIKSMFANSKMNRKERGSLNNILVQLRKCLCHPFIYSEAIEERNHDQAVVHQNLVEASAKLILLQVMLPKLKEKGHRVLIFSQFLQQLDIVEDFLIGMGYGFRRLDGQISSLEKQRRIDAFNAPGSELFAFLLSTRAGGVGINLATADTVIIMDPDFNPHQDIQALSRAHRIGQKKEVLCFQLVTKNSVEERIMQIGRKKMALDHALIESMDDDDLGGDDLESILKHGAQALFSDDYQKEAIQYDSASIDKLLDRTKLVQKKTSDEESEEAQFTYAKVWANEKSAFEDGLGIEEDEAPEPINSSVWDRILAEREEEAKKEAEADREMLGRGRRRTTAGNYKTEAVEGAEAESDTSDVYSGAGSADESEDDAAAPGKGKRRQITPKPAKIKTPTNTATKSKIKNAINSEPKQKYPTKSTPPTKRKASMRSPTNARQAKSLTQTPKKKPLSARECQVPTPIKAPQKGQQKNSSQKEKKSQGGCDGSPTALATPAPTPPTARPPKHPSGTGLGSPTPGATSEIFKNV